jgi:integrase
MLPADKFLSGEKGGSGMTAQAKRRAKAATVAEVNSLSRAPGRHSIGESLILCVSPSGAKSWVARVRDAEGKRRDMGLGPFADLTLAEAREKARTLRKAGRDGMPILTRAERRAKRRAENADLLAIPTFRKLAERFHENRKVKWKNGKHQNQWLATLELYAFPKLGDLRVDRITVPMIAEVIAEVWREKPETGRRVRQRIAAVLTWAHDLEYRDQLSNEKLGRALGEQPLTKGHFAALPYVEVADLIAILRERETVGNLALEFTILTAARSGETRGATWSEFDLDKKLWTIPPTRMKAGREHMVPISERAIAIIKRVKEFASSDIVFPGVKGKPMSDATLGKALREAGIGKEQGTVHGFRSAFRDWCSEETSFSGEVAEAALAHAIRDKTEAAYRRGSLLVKRREMMNAWAKHCEGHSNVVLMVAG